MNLELQTQIQPALGAEVCPFTLIGEDLPLLLKLAGHCPSRRAEAAVPT